MESEIAQMEAQQGNDVKFINPDPGYVVKTKLVPDGTKVFVNICQVRHRGDPPFLFPSLSSGKSQCAAK